MNVPANLAAADGAAPAPPDPSPAVGHRVAYDGRPGSLAKIVITNALLTLVTLGIYRFWGKTRVRRHLWSRVSFLGDRAEYTGTGGELFRGFLVAIAALALLAAVPIGAQWWIGIDHPAYWTAEAAYALILLFLVNFAVYRARRYRLNRTEWRGIRFAQDGSSVRYALLALGWGAVTVLSLGLAYVVFRARLQRYRTTHTVFGDRRFEFDGRASELFTAWIVAWLLWLPTLGLAYLWYRVREFRYFAEKTRCGSLGFASDARAGRVILIVVAFYFLTLLLLALAMGTVFGIATALDAPALLDAMEAGGHEALIDSGAAVLAGLAVAIVVFYPLISIVEMLFLVHPLFRVILNSVTVAGEEDYGSIFQASQAAPRQGEGLADALDVGAV